MKISGPRQPLILVEPKTKTLPTSSQAGPRFTFESVDQRRTHLMGLVETPSALMGALTENPLNVGVIGFSAQGGSGNIARMMAGGLQRAGHDVTYMTAKDGFWSSHADTGVRVRDLDMPTAPTAPTPEVESRIAAGLVEAVKAQDLDVVWVHYAAGLLGGALKAKEQLAEEGRPLKVAVTLHGTDVSAWGRSEYRNVLRDQLLKADTVTAVSSWLANEARSTFEIASPDVVPNSISIDTFQPNRWSVAHNAVGAGSDIRRRMVADGEVLISHASNLREVKRPLDLVEAFAKIRRRMPAKLMLMGETDPDKNPMVGKMHDLAVKLGVAQDIIPVGVLGPEELARHYAASDLSLITSSSESFSLAALESMANGVPVIGTRCGGLEEVMRGVAARANGSSRLLVDVGDTDAMAEKAVRLLSTRDHYQAAQRDGLAVPFARYTEAAQMSAYLDVLDDLVIKP